MSTPGRPAAVDLAMLLARDTALFWFEAVAIVQELCAVLPATRQAGRRSALDLEDIALTADGTVELRGITTRGVPTVPQVAHVLLALLEEARTLPVQLRLLALQEVSPTPSWTTLADFSSQLAPFERPGRRDAIREIVERFARTPARESGELPKEAPRAMTARTARLPWWRNRRVHTAGAAVALLVAAGIGAAWLWRWVVPVITGWRDRPVAEAASAAGQSMSEEHAERIRAAARRVWLGGAQLPAVPAPPPGPAAELVAVAIAPPSAATTVPIPAVRETGLATPVTAAPAGWTESAPGGTVFSAGDQDVLPPLPMWPHLPTTAKAGIHLADLPLVELVVTPKGDVESVKLVTRQTDVRSAMMLSAVKAWRFAPATREGKPVAYRLAVRLTNQ